MAVTTVRLSDETEAELSAIAARTERSRSWLINRAVAEYIERDRVARERWAQTLSAVESAASGNVVAAETVHEWLGSWGTDSESDPPAVDS